MDNYSIRTDAEVRCKRAFERRFGQSCVPLRAWSRNPDVIRVKDDETGSWIDFDISAWRIRRLEEHDAQATS